MSGNRKITNTEKLEAEAPLALFALLVDRGVEGLESMGQDELVQSEQIPVEIRDITEAGLEAMGFKLGPACAGDPLFREATLPTGWKKRPTDHSSWSEIVDQDGYVGFQIFYKAASYDRRAFMQAALRP